MKETEELLDAVKLAIREAGLRATPGRIATLRLLRGSRQPLNHAAVVKQLSDVQVDKATVFRSLNDMSDAGLVRRIEVGDHVWLDESVDLVDKNDTGHPRFLCVECGVVICLDDVKLTAGSQRACRRVGEVPDILLRGHCNRCR